jgi:intraflagellar transport protein 140
MILLIIIENPKTQPVSEFNTDKTLNVWMYKERVFLCQNYGIVAATMQGQAKDNIGFADSEGVLRGSNRNNNFLVAYTSNNYIRIYDLSKKELKQIGVTRKFEDSKGSLGENIVCNINCDGSKVSIITNVKKDDAFENVLYIYDVEFDTFTPYKFGKNHVLVHN